MGDEITLGSASNRTPDKTVFVNGEQALRCRDPSLTWCSQDIARWEMVHKLMDEGKQLSSTGDYDSAVRVFTQVGGIGD